MHLAAPANAAWNFLKVNAGIGRRGWHDCPLLLDGSRGCVRNRVSCWPSPKRREILRGDVVKYVAIRKSLLFEKTLFDELLDGLRNFRRPFLDAGVEHPPMKDAVDGVLRIRMSGQIIENFWRRRWKQRVDKHRI